MFKHIVLIIVLSVLIVLFTPYAQQGVQYLLDAHTWISQLLTDIFTEAEAGTIARRLIALLFFPFVIGLIPALPYWLIRKSWMPGFMRIVWIVWLVQTGALLVVVQAAGAVGG